MSERGLGQFLRAAHRQLADAERFTSASDSDIEAAAGQLGRLTGVLSRYLTISGTSSTGRPWSRPRAEMADAISAAAVPLRRWVHQPSEQPGWSANCAGVICAAADSLDAGYGLLLSHLKPARKNRRPAGPGGDQ